jgi:putative zinc finger/helix-turn-helix YgiT family protein
MTLSSSRTGPKCPECEHGFLVPFIRDEEFDYDLGDESIKVVAKDVPVERCDSCGIVASGPAAAKVRHEAVCRAAGFLTPTEYKSIREQRGWSQQHLADLTGCGVATVARAERGRIMPNRSYDKVLRALRDCTAFREYLQGLLAAGRGSGTGGSPAEAKRQEARPAVGNGKTPGPTLRVLKVPTQEQTDQAKRFRPRSIAC